MAAIQMGGVNNIISGSNGGFDPLIRLLQHAFDRMGDLT